MGKRGSELEGRESFPSLEARQTLKDESRAKYEGRVPWKRKKEKETASSLGQG